MMTESIVVDVSQDWAVACDLQERFMEVPHAKTQRLRYSARCRQMRALGGDCFTFLPLPGGRVAFAVAERFGDGEAFGDGFVGEGDFGEFSVRARRRAIWPEMQRVD